MHLFTIAGESSGDQYGARVLRALRDLDPGLTCDGIGGDAMKSEGANLLFHTSQTSIMGFVEVLRHAGFLRRMFAECEQALIRRRPDVLLLIDYPGFNLRMAAIARRHGIPVLYYIAPQVWAWGRHRVRKLKERVDRLAVVFPFEKDFFSNAGIEAEFVGHPLLEILGSIPRQDFLAAHHLPDQPLLALLPGSREQEVRRILPVMMDTARELVLEFQVRPIIGAARLPDALFTPWLDRCPEALLVRHATHGLLEHATCALVTSGTATVETAFYRTPFAVLYKAGRINYEIGKRLVRVPYIGMVNLLAGREVAPEFIQDDCRPDRILSALRPLLADPLRHARVVEDLGSVRTQMGERGASTRVAEMVLRLAKGDSVHHR